MLIKGDRLYKCEKLCCTQAIDALFVAGRGHKAEAGDPIYSAMVYPWRAVWRTEGRHQPDCAQFVISVPKKRLRHAVDRVQMRRRGREAYRLNRALLPAGCRAEIVFIYIADGLQTYSRCERSFQKLLKRIAESYKPAAGTDNEATD